MNTEQTNKNNFMYYVLNNEDQLKTSHRSLWQQYFKKTLQGQERKERFRKTEMVFIKIYNLHHIYYIGNCLVNLLPGLLRRQKQKIACCFFCCCFFSFFAVPTIVKTAMEALPLLIIYLFNYGRLDLVLNIC